MLTFMIQIAALEQCFLPQRQGVVNCNCALYYHAHLGVLGIVRKGCFFQNNKPKGLQHQAGMTPLP